MKNISNTYQIEIHTYFHILVWPSLTSTCLKVQQLPHDWYLRRSSGRTGAKMCRRVKLSQSLRMLEYFAALLLCLFAGDIFWNHIWGASNGYFGFRGRYRVRYIDNISQNIKFVSWILASTLIDSKEMSVPFLRDITKKSISFLWRIKICPESNSACSSGSHGSPFWLGSDPESKALGGF